MHRLALALLATLAACLPIEAFAQASLHGIKPADTPMAALPYAVSQVHAPTDKACRNHDDEGSEGDDFLRICPGKGPYRLQASGSVRSVNYGIVTADRELVTMLFPSESGPAARYVRADRYDQRLNGTLRWLLDTTGTPYAVIAYARFYKAGSASKKGAKPVAEFYLVRGLTGFDTLQEDVPIGTDADYVPIEEAQRIARDYLMQNRRADE